MPFSHCDVNRENSGEFDPLQACEDEKATVERRLTAAKLTPKTPFTDRFNAVMHERKVKRQKFHGGSLNGHACYCFLMRLLRFFNLDNLLMLMVRSLVLVKTGVGVAALMRTLNQCQVLFMKTSSLCDHEIALGVVVSKCRAPS